MGLPLVGKERKHCAKLVVECGRAISHYGKPAALGWAVRGKRGNDDVAAEPYGTEQRGTIGISILWRGQKMEDGAIVPNVILVHRQRQLGDVTHQPGYCAGTCTQSCLCGVKRGFRNVE